MRQKTQRYLGMDERQNTFMSLTVKQVAPVYLAINDIKEKNQIT